MFDRNQTTNVYLHMRLYVQVSFTEISRRLTIKNSTPVCELWCVSTSLFCDQNERLGTRVKARSVHFILKKRRESGAASASPPPTAHLMEGPCHGETAAWHKHRKLPRETFSSAAPSAE